MGKGADTRERILRHAVRMASQSGLDGVTVGGLAEELGLSKSGLFAHFGSKDILQVQVLETAVSRFQDVVVRAALRAPRGEPRVRALFERWLAWGKDPEMPGGCVLIAAAVEFDDKPGRQRDFLVATQREIMGTIVKAARLAVEAGDFRKNLDAEQFAFELNAILLGYHHTSRLLRDPLAEQRVHTAFDRLLVASRG